MSRTLAPGVRIIPTRVVLDPELASILMAFALAGALGLPALRRAVRRGERFCESCGRRILLGQRTCDCDH